MRLETPGRIGIATRASARASSSAETPSRSVPKASSARGGSALAASGSPSGSTASNGRPPAPGSTVSTFATGSANCNPAPAPVVLLEQPRNMGNIGACVRVAAAAGAGALLSTGENDPWFPDAVRGGAGLQFALPVAKVEGIEPGGGERPLLAVDPEGEPLAIGALPPRALLAFGTERDGVSTSLLERAEARVAIPMRPGVSSLNLATSVAVVLFALRLGSD